MVGVGVWIVVVVGGCGTVEDVELVVGEGVDWLGLGRGEYGG